MEKRKPKIIILMHYLELGGAEISLIGLLNALDPKRVDVDLFIYSHQGPLMHFIPPWIHLLTEKKDYSMIEKPLKDVIRKGYWRIAWARFIAKYRHSRYRKNNEIKGDDISMYQYLGNAITPYLPKINPNIEYDLCISFLLPHNIGLKKVKAKKKLAWIHTDYSTVHVNADLELPVWADYDYIASISSNVSDTFLQTFPSLRNKILEIENIIATNYIKTKAEEFDAQKELSKF